MTVSTNEKQPPTKTSPCTTIGLLTGVILGYPLSYYFQPDALRAKLTLGGYIEHVSEILKDNDLRTTVIVCFVVAIGVCGVIGFALDKKK